jgi:hypothetical protein
MPGLVQDEAGDPEQEDGVGDGGQDLGAMEAVRPAGCGRPGGHPERRERHREAEDVGEHVAGVGEQRERAGEEAADHLGDEVRGSETENHQESTLVRCCRVVRARAGVRRLPVAVLVRCGLSVRWIGSRPARESFRTNDTLSGAIETTNGLRQFSVGDACSMVR